MKKGYVRFLLFTGFFSMGIILAGCVGPPLPMARSLDDVGADEVIVVGRIEIDPPLDNTEQNLKTISASGGGILINPSAGDYRNKVILLTGQKLHDISDPSISDYRDRIITTIGETFHVRSKKAPFYVIRSEIWMKLTDAGMQKALLPSGYKIDIRPADEAVYIGTIRYHRDEFFETKRMELIDDYNKENDVFRKKFGLRLKLRKALATKDE